MPKHKIFVGDYGRSSTYAMKKRATEEFDIVISGSDDDADTSQNDRSSSIDILVSSTRSDIPTNDVDVDDSHYDEDGPDRIDDGITDKSEELDVDNDTDIDFDDGDSDEEHDDNLHQPVYAGAPISLGESMVSILTFVLCYNLTGSALCDLLALISLHCQQPNILKTSLYTFRKYFEGVRYPIVKHYFCSTCYSRLDTSNSTCDTCRIANGVSYFIEIPILRQLQVLFKRRGFYEKLQHRFNREKGNSRNLEDIHDGDVYRELVEDDGFLSNPNNISFTWNTDGVSIFKSSGYQIWPFYLMVNELPYIERIKQDNILLAGLWFGTSKPAPNLFLSPIHDAIREINDGVYLNIPRQSAPIKVRGKVICGTCDLPAKSLFLNMTQFNGHYGCPKCKLEGQSKDRVWTYPFERSLTPRSDEETRRFAEEALRTNTPIYGVKGPSKLSLFVHKFIRTTAVDSMHCVFAGVVKKMLTIFFDPVYSDHPASLSEFVDLVDSRLHVFTPPSFLQRRPRSIKNHLKYWKANELKAWFFYYSLPILHDIMPSQYFEHYCMLVMAIFTLHQNSISFEMLNNASRLLREFVNRFDIMYGERHMSCNLHQLLHLPETVRDFGPLWVTSCFPFEDMNGKLKRLIHSSHCPELQICSAISTLLNASSLRNEILPDGSAAQKYCNNLSNPRKKMRLQNLMVGISSVGLCRITSSLSLIGTEALERANVVGRKFVTFSRLMKNGLLYTAQTYTRSIKYDNTCVRYRNLDDSTEFGVVHSFVKVHNCDCHRESVCQCYAPSYAIIRSCDLLSILPQKFLCHIPELVLECTDLAEQAVAINVEQLVDVCFMLTVADTQKSYVVLPANLVEIE